MHHDALPKILIAITVIILLAIFSAINLTQKRRGVKI